MKAFKIIVTIFTVFVICIIGIIAYAYFFQPKNNQYIVQESISNMIFLRRGAISDQLIIDNLGKNALIKAYDKFYIIQTDEKGFEFVKNNTSDYILLPNKIISSATGNYPSQVKIKSPVNNTKRQEIGNNVTIITDDKFNTDTIIVWSNASEIEKLKSLSSVESIDAYSLYEKINPEVFNSTENPKIKLVFIIESNRKLDEIQKIITSLSTNTIDKKQKEMLKGNTFLQTFETEMPREGVIQLLNTYPELILVDK